MSPAILIFVVLCLVCPSAFAELKAGFAERDITPAIGSEMPGGYGKAFHKKFHDACKVRAVVFDNGDQRVALVGLDALMVPRQLVLSARQAIAERCGIPTGAVLIGASHSHSSGPLGFVQPGEYDSASELVRKLAYEKSPGADPGYLRTVETAMVDAVCAANENRATARIGFGAGTEDKVAFNRRHHMKNGLTFTHPGKGNPDMLDYAGPTDPQVGVIGVWDQKGKFLGCIVNFACHATTSPDGISANWIYYLERAIRGYFGADAEVVFLQGACGDITQVDNAGPYANPNGEDWAQIVGGRVGAEAVKVLLNMLPARATNAVVAASGKTWRIPRRVPDPVRVAEARTMIEKGQPSSTDWTFAKETLLLDALVQKDRSVEVEVQAIQLGPAVLISNPAELFCNFGLDLKRRSPFLLTFPVELANGCVGYVPTEEALGPHGGGYETRLTSYSNLDPSAGRQFVEAGLELATKMKPGQLPQPSKAPPFSAPWAYGNLPPQLK